ncbi:MAG TPA: RNA methyltransferase [Cytophagaceae bacterium]
MAKLKLEELNRISVEEFKNKEKNPVILVLDNVRSLNNVGSAFRTADAFLVQKIYLCGITGTPPNKEIHKTALGATESVDWEYVSSTVELVRKLKSEGWKIISLEQTDNSVMLQDFEFQKQDKLCFIFGNEVFGVDDEVINESHLTLEIPQFGTKHSLNISVSIGMVIWDYFSKTTKTK